MQLPVVKLSRKYLLLVVALAFGAIGSVALVNIFAAGPNQFASNVKAVVAESDTQDGTYVITRSGPDAPITGFQPVNFRLYGDGRLICGNFSSTPGTITTTTLSADQMTSLADSLG